MNQPPVLGGNNNGGNELLPQQNHSNKKSTSPEVKTSPPKLTTLPPTPRINPINRRTTHIFYKTRMCHKFLEGNCGNAECCTFAHGPQDLREPPPNWQELVRGQILNDDERIIQQMKICRKFAKNDECPYGEKCSFLHESPAKFKTEPPRTLESSVINIQTIVGRRQPNGSHAIKVSTASSDPDASFWKTRICNIWETTGQCVFGDKCHFAHGFTELHTPITQMESEGSTAANLLRIPMTKLQPSDSTIVVPLQQVEGRGFAKLGLSHKKIKRIYGYWIDD